MVQRAQGLSGRLQERWAQVGSPICPEGRSLPYNSGAGSKAHLCSPQLTGSEIIVISR